MHSAAMRVRHAMAFATHKFFNDRGFLYIHTPIVTGADCEGAGEQFGVSTLLPEEGGEGGDNGHSGGGGPPMTPAGNVDYSKVGGGRNRATIEVALLTRATIEYTSFGRKLKWFLNDGAPNFFQNQMSAEFRPKIVENFVPFKKKRRNFRPKKIVGMFVPKNRRNIRPQINRRHFRPFVFFVISRCVPRPWDDF